MRPSMLVRLGAFVVALALVACADEASSQSPGVSSTASSVPAPLVTPHPLRPTGTAPLAPPPTFGPPTATATFAPLVPSGTQRPAPTPPAPAPRTPTPERPSSPVHPPGTRTGLAELDPVLEAFDTGDLDAVMEVVELSETVCSEWQDPLAAWEGCTSDQTVASGFMWANFEPFYVIDPSDRLDRLLQGWLGVYAVVRPPTADPYAGPPADYLVIFVVDDVPRDFEGGVALVREGHLVGIGGWGVPRGYLERDGVGLEVVLPPSPEQRGP